MEQITCPSCNLVNPPGELICRKCGVSLAVPYATPTVVVPVSTPSDTIVVDRSGMSQQAMLVTMILGLLAIVGVGMLMYTWGRSTQSDEDARNARNTRTDRAATDSRPAPSAPLPAPGPAPAPAPAPTTIIMPPTSAPGGPVAVPPAPAPGASPAEAAAEAACTKYIAQVDPLIREWNDLLTSAETSSGPAHTEVLERMKEVQRKVTRVPAAACAGSVQGRLLTAMASTIDALKSVPASEVPHDSAALSQARELYQRFEVEYAELKAAHP